MKTTVKIRFTTQEEETKNEEVKGGDEIGIGDKAYRIIGILPDSHVIGKMIVEHGYFVDSETQHELDLRLSGWEFLKRD